MGGGFSANIVNTATQYGIGGYNALFTGPFSDANLFIGPEAGMHNVGGQGIGNTFAGNQAGFSNSTAAFNTFIGFQAGSSATTGSDNTIVGYAAGTNITSQVSNVFFGVSAGQSATGSHNAFLGPFAGQNLAGDYNIALGDAAGAPNS